MRNPNVVGKIIKLNVLINVIFVILINLNGKAFGQVTKCITCEEDPVNPNGCENDGSTLNDKSVDCTTGDVCFVLKDETDGGLIKRGCGESTYCDDKADCKICKDDDCNILNPVLQCYDCTSDFTTPNSDCLRLESTPSISDCPGKCVTKFGPSSIERGCLDLIGTCEELSGCEPCRNEDFCNAKIFQECYKCESDATENCATLAELDLVPKEYCEECYVKIEGDGHITRGCVAELSVPCTDPSCDTCSNERLCNKKKGLSCYICDDVSCLVPSLLPEQCGTFEGDDVCYTVGESQNKAYRGCLSDSLSDGVELCVTNVEVCEKCPISNCNTNDHKYLDTCFKCDPDKANAECATDPSNQLTCTDGILSGEQIKCYTSIEAGPKIERGCLTEKEDDVPGFGTNCDILPNYECNICEGQNCNKDKLVECYSCESDATGNCARLAYPDGLSKEYCEECYVEIDEIGYIKRGCVAALSSPCTDPLCYQCANGQLCNDKKGLHCHICDDVACLVPGLLPEQCGIFEDDGECYTVGESLNIAYRGCLSDVSSIGYGICTNNFEACQDCQGSNCNIHYPKYLDTCFKCDPTKDNAECAKDPLNQLTCTDIILSGEQIKCYTSIEDGLNIERGCVTEKEEKDPDFATTCNGLPDEECKTCDGKNCNKDKLVECYSCTSNDVDDDCATLAIGLNTEYCDACFTRIDEDFNIHRGCLSKLPVCNTDTNCERCYTELCNKKKQFNCYSCIDDMCSTGTSVLEPCGLFEDDSVSCYAVTKSDTEAYRGCVLENASPGYDYCKSEGPVCKLCHESECNNQELHERATCYNCNSITGGSSPDCFNKPLDQQTCEIVIKPEGNANCYTIIDGGSDIHRGCYNDESDDFKNNCNDDDDCVLCPTSLCNKETYKPYCYSCNSASDPNCGTITDPSILEVELCDMNDKCFSMVDEHDIVRRGCYSPNSVDLCIGPACETCDSSYCNKEVFPADRRLCYTCAGADCLQFNPTHSEEPCLSYWNPPNCYTAIVDNTFAYRGCVEVEPSTEGQKHCNDYPDLCKKCIGSHCNTDEGLRREICYKCKNNELDCKTTPGTSVNCPALINRDTCYTFNDGQNFERGCLSEADSTIRTACDNKKDCVSCSGNLCNDISEYLSNTCFVCNSVQNSDCEKQIENIIPSTCSPGTAGGQVKCFLRLSGEYFVRGCVSSLYPITLEQCEDPDNNDCKICTGMNCNQKLTFHKCHKCDYTDDDCHSIPSQEEFCTEYYDECIVFVNENGETIRGCLKEIENQGNLPAVCGSASCETCPEDSCNGEIFPQNRLQCNICPPENEDCQSDLSQSDDFLDVCKIHKTDDECYSLLVGDKFERGCLSSALPETILKCNNNVDPSCFKCSGQGCNSIPLSFPKCITCDSSKPGSTNIDCVSGGSYSKTCTNYNDECVVYINDNGATIRGCLKEVKDEYYTIPATCTASICKTCSEIDCNKNIFPEDRLKCNICPSENEECQSDLADSTDFLDLCKIHKTDDECYSLVVDDKFERGCLASASPETIPKCDNNADSTCFKCSGQGCNSIPLSFPKCISCDSSKTDSTNSDCVSGGSHSKICDNYNDECVVYINDNGATIRGCLKEVKDEYNTIPATCTASICKTCSEIDCNKNIFPEDRLKCNICPSENEECQSDLADSTDFLDLCKIHKTDDECYSLVVDDKFERGCLASASPETIPKCDNNADSTCFKCSGQGCNSIPLSFPKCISCDSSKTDSTNSDCVSGGSHSKICDNYNDECVVYINDNGATIRGCLKEVKDEYNTIPAPCTASICKTCSEIDCNKNIFPEDRLKCNICPSENEECQSDLADSTDFLDLCKIHKTDDECYSLLVGDKFERGCLSSSSPETILKCDNNADSSCLKCSDQRCNFVASRKDATLKCINCNETESNCEWKHLESEAKNCKNEVLFGETEGCYILKNDGMITRGCMLDDGVQFDKCTNDVNCSPCDINACNSVGYRNQTCLVCSSTESPGCDGMPQLITPSKCGDQTYDNRGCFTLKRGSIVERGCFSSLNITEQEFCRDEDNETCKVCFDDTCNNSLANSLKITSMAIILGLASISVFL